MVNLPAVLIANATGIMLMLIMMKSTHKSVRYGLLDEKMFYVMTWLTIVQCLNETATLWLDGKLFPGAHTLSIVLNSILFTVSIQFSFVWAVYADYKLFENKERLKKIYRFVGIPAGILSLASLCNLFVPVFFTVDAQNRYARTPLSNVMFFFSYAYLFYGVILIYVYRKKAQKYLFLPAVIFLIPVVLCGIAQFLCYGLSLLWMGTAVALVSLYMNVQNENSYVDHLSGLYSRQYLYNYLYAQTKKDYSGWILEGIMLDIDQFKKINDTYGHVVGDHAIQNAGAILREAVGPDAFASRFAGDEFMVIRWVRDRRESEALVARIREITRKRNASGAYEYRLHFSMGSSWYEGEGDTINDFLKRMDQAMYENKRKRAEKG